MNSREEILGALRKIPLAPVALPELEGEWLSYADPLAQFTEVTRAVGGAVLRIDSADLLEEGLQQLEVYRQAACLWSLVPHVESRGADWGAFADPHELERLECCIVPGDFAVAENGAVWLTDEAISQRSALFITQHLILVVSAAQIVQNMHEAYARLSVGASPFGIFIAGPSKTADIEQSLVIGAHGARSLTVALVGPERE